MNNLHGMRIDFNLPIHSVYMHRNLYSCRVTIPRTGCISLMSTYIILNIDHPRHGYSLTLNIPTFSLAAAMMLACNLFIFNSTAAWLLFNVPFRVSFYFFRDRTLFTYSTSHGSNLPLHRMFRCANDININGVNY